jgi:glutathione S-transferase
MARELYELVGRDPARPFSPYCWRARMALAHKGLDAVAVPWRFTETDRLSFANHDKVPVLVDGDTAVVDSWSIAEYLDRIVPAAPLLGAAAPHIRLIAAWVDTALHGALIRLVVSDILTMLDEPAASYFRASREARLGARLEDVTADREARLPAFRALLQPLRVALRAGPFLGGVAPDYADYAVFGAFQWARVVSPLVLVEDGDPVHPWLTRMLGLYGGLAGAVPARR